MKLLSVFLSFIIVLALTSLLSYASGPTADGLEWDYFNPLSAIEGILFAFTFALGMPVWLAVALVLVLFAAVWYGLYRLLCRAMGGKEVRE
jgi:hypothetical protein